MEKEDRYETIVHPLNPFYKKDSKILILGSFPSIKTREYGFFYGHPQNRFWKLMEILFNTSLSRDIDERKKFLSENKIALYDSIFQCDIIMSSDSSIKNVVLSDIESIIKNSEIREVFLNGATSYKYFKKNNLKDFSIRGIKLPSTSPLNARYSLDDLVDSWKIILSFL